MFELLHRPTPAAPVQLPSKTRREYGRQGSNESVERALHSPNSTATLSPVYPVAEAIGESEGLVWYAKYVMQGVVADGKRLETPDSWAMPTSSASPEDEGMVFEMDL